MVLLIHTSDIHLGVDKYARSPLARAYIDVLDEIASKTVELGSRYVVVSGDVFHSVNPPMDTIFSAIRILKKLRENGVRVIVVPGNHDNSTSRKGILELLAETGLIYLLDYSELHNYLVLKPLVFEDDRLVFYGIPGFRGSREVEYLTSGTVKFIDVKKYEDYNTIVVAHVSTKMQGYDPTKYASRYGKVATDEGELFRKIPARARYVALGHIHIPVPFEKEFKGRAAYPGAPIGMDANDLRESALLGERAIKRRFLVVDISQDTPSIKAVELENTPLVVLRKIKAKSADDVVRYASEAVRELPSKPRYRALLLYVTGLERLEAKVIGLIRELSTKHETYIEVHAVPREEELGLFTSLSMPEEIELNLEKVLLDVETLEESVLRDMASRYKLPLSADKLKWLLNRLSEPVAGSARYEELIAEIEKELFKGEDSGRD